MSKKKLMYFIIEIVSVNLNGFIIWYEYGVETINKKFLFFGNLDTLYKYSSLKNIVLEENEITKFNLNDLEKDISSRKINSDSRNNILNWWNLSGDITCSMDNNEIYNLENDIVSDEIFRIERYVSYNYYKNKKKAFKFSKIIYEKLFTGNWDYYNYEKKRIYKIRWSNAEYRMLLRIMRYGIDFFKDNIRLINTEKDFDTK